MKYHIVSDNLYFLLGVRGLFNQKEIFAFIYHTDEMSMVELMREINNQLKPGDVLVIAVRNIHIRRDLMKLPKVFLAKVLFIPFFTVNAKTTGALPWILASNVTAEAFFVVLRQIEKAVFMRKRITYENLVAMDFLTQGEKITNLAEISGWNIKKLYYQRAVLLKKSGLSRTTDHEVLLSRDILSLLRRFNFETKPNSATPRLSVTG
ncbi:hypothetical protein EDF73_101326 [Raoultella sp. BIGb0138]|uniref:hypothetical protein n=1 Tax=Raoultella sp. BIGb0138 TaxID=2485115 RepID=UPI00104B64EA|nr:hypothetical protein [Raoultella sp. BIGb0138]TCW17677.1 hypothetical protein EDF73_101326 [Raoultella sp. BIGb0138]